MRYWSLPEQQLLVQLYQKGLSIKQLTAVIGRNENSIKAKLWQLGLSSPRPTENDHNYLLNNYKKLPTDEIAQTLGISTNALYVRFHRLKNQLCVSG
jgi:hypothetical protein